jgi:hypothetical protein
VKYGKKVFTAIADIRDPSSSLETQHVRSRILWDSLQSSIRFVTEISDTLPQTVQDLLESQLRILLAKFQLVISKHFKITQSSTLVARTRYALSSKGTLEDLLDDLEKWQTRFLQYLQLTLLSVRKDEPPSSAGFTAAPGMMRIQSFAPADNQPGSETAAITSNIITRIKAALQHDHSSSAPTNPARIFGDNELKPLPNSTVWIPTSQSALPSKVLIEPRFFDSANDLSAAAPTILRTVLTLHGSHPPLTGILRTTGYTTHTSPPRVNIYLSIPSSVAHISPVSLRTLLLSNTSPRHSLSSRLLLAKKLATAVFYIHLSRLVHKHIRPESILLFPSPSRSLDLGTPYLVGFGDIRSQDIDSTRLIGVKEPARMVYSHATRIGERAAEPYNVRHDVYSLGIVLLEVALWTSFVSGQGELNGKVFSDKFGRKLEMAGRQEEAAEAVKGFFVGLARKNVPPVMGGLYAKVVEKCLVMQDEAEVEESEVFNGYNKEEEERQAVRYVESILEGLEKIVL